MRRDLIALPDSSRVWVYQSATFIDYDTSEEIKAHLYDFTLQWTSHNQAIDTYAQLFHHKFLVFVADESNHVSGCSIDSSVNFIKSLEQKYNLNFFDRLNFSYFKDDHVHTIASHELKAALESGQLTEETLMFDNLVNSKEAFIDRWVVPLKDSWYTKYLP